MVAPFSVDTYIPAFDAIGHALNASSAQLQQTLSAFLFGFAVMALFHGALSDSFGRRSVVLTSLFFFTLASLGGAMSTSIEALICFRVLQGLTSGAGWVISSAVVRDVYPQAQAQRMISQITLFTGVAPALAPIIGALLLTHFGWQAIFWFMALLGACLLLFNWCVLPETLPQQQRQPFNLSNLLQGYWQLATNGRFILLTLANDLPFNGFFIYVACAPAFLSKQLHLKPDRFFLFFSLLIAGVMIGSWLSGRLAGKLPPQRQIKWGFVVMALAAVMQCMGHMWWQPQLWWSLPLVGLFATGWAIMTPAMTMLLLSLSPNRKGMAASLMTFVLSMSNAWVAGAVATAVMHSSVAIAAVAFTATAIGLLSWLVVKGRLP